MKIREELEKLVQKALSEGLSNSPFTVENAKLIAKVLSEPITFSELYNNEKSTDFFAILDDDRFWDELKNSIDHDLGNADVRSFICDTLKDYMKAKDTFVKDAYTEEGEEIIKKAIAKFEA